MFQNAMIRREKQIEWNISPIEYKVNEVGSLQCIKSNKCIYYYLSCKPKAKLDKQTEGKNTTRTLANDPSIKDEKCFRH